MFITADVDIPDELVTGPKKPLVIFVGAGVSLDIPSSLPTFRQLTEQVARNFGKTMPQAQCIASASRVACGYNCLSAAGQVGCATSPLGLCKQRTAEVICFGPQ